MCGDKPEPSILRLSCLWELKMYRPRGVQTERMLFPEQELLFCIDNKWVLHNKVHSQDAALIVELSV